MLAEFPGSGLRGGHCREGKSGKAGKVRKNWGKLIEEARVSLQGEYRQLEKEVIFDQVMQLLGPKRAANLWTNQMTPKIYIFSMIPNSNLIDTKINKKST